MELRDKIDLLKSEYFKLQDFYENYDGKAHTIKGWSATISLAAISAGFSYKNDFIWLFAIPTTITFWMIETKWKIFQYAFSQRIKEIETAFAKDDFGSVLPIQIYSSWFKSYMKRVKNNHYFFRIMSLNLVVMPYLYIIITCFILFVLQHFHTFLGIPPLYNT